MLGGTGKMKGIGASQKDRGGRLPEDLLRPFPDAIGKRKPLEKAIHAILLKLLECRMKGRLIHPAFPEGSMQGSHHFRLGMPGGPDRSSSTC